MPLKLVKKFYFHLSFLIYISHLILFFDYVPDYYIIIWYIHSVSVNFQSSFVIALIRASAVS